MLLRLYGMGLDIRTIENYEWEGIWKEAAVACFHVLSQNLPGGTEEHHYGHQYSRSLSEIWTVL